MNEVPINIYLINEQTKGMVILPKNEHVVNTLVGYMPTALAVVECILFDWFLPVENSFLVFFFFFFFFK